jgi:hypothetical protein
VTAVWPPTNGRKYNPELILISWILAAAGVPSLSSEAINPPVWPPSGLRPTAEKPGTYFNFID